jgi:hypothetical protein
VITSDNLPEFLAVLGFAKTKSVWRKAIGGAALSVDAAKQQLIYPEAQRLKANNATTGLFDLNGDYCFASYLVRVVPDTAKVQPLFLTRMMNSAAFQKEAKSKAAKAINQANINATVMKNLKVPLPSLV